MVDRAYLEQWLTDMGFRVRYKSLGKALHGMLAFRVCTVNSDDSAEEQLFTLAHEAGHVLRELPSVKRFLNVGQENPHWLSKRRVHEEGACDGIAREILGGAYTLNEPPELLQERKRLATWKRNSATWGNSS